MTIDAAAADRLARFGLDRIAGQVRKYRHRLGGNDAVLDDLASAASYRVARVLDRAAACPNPEGFIAATVAREFRHRHIDHLRTRKDAADVYAANPPAFDPSPPTVAMFREEMAGSDTFHRSHTRIYSDAEIDAFRRIVREHPGETDTAIAARFNRLTGRHLYKSTVYRLRKRLGIAHHERVNA